MEEHEEKPERALESGRDTRPNRIKHGENSGPMKKGFRRPKPGKESEPTRHLCVIGVGPAHDDELRDACVSFGKVLGFDHHQKVTLGPLKPWILVQSIPFLVAHVGGYVDPGSCAEVATVLYIGCAESARDL